MCLTHKVKRVFPTKIAAAYLYSGFILFYPKVVNATPIMDDQENPHPASTASTYWLGDAEKYELSHKADKGDKDAAFRLAQYYSFVEFDGDKEQYWLERSASSGHAIAQYNLAFLLFNKANPDTSAALYWAEMAKRNGEEKAQFLIDEIRGTSK